MGTQDAAPRLLDSGWGVLHFGVGLWRSCASSRSDKVENSRGVEGRVPPHDLDAEAAVCRR
jgi:hypothetical protein